MTELPDYPFYEDDVKQLARLPLAFRDSDPFYGPSDADFKRDPLNAPIPAGLKREEPILFTQMQRERIDRAHRALLAEIDRKWQYIVSGDRERESNLAEQARRPLADIARQTRERVSHWLQRLRQSLGNEARTTD